MYSAGFTKVMKSATVSYVQKMIFLWKGAVNTTVQDLQEPPERLCSEKKCASNIELYLTKDWLLES